MNTAKLSEKRHQIQVGSVFYEMDLTRKHYYVGLVLFVAFIIEAWEMMMMIFISGKIAEEFSLTPVQVGSIIGSMFLGMIPGAYLWGMIVDKIGRKKSIVYSLLGFAALSLISAFSVGFEMLFAMRFLAGIALAGLLACVFPYFEEMLPVKSRGKAGVYLSAGWPLGTMLAVGITVLLLHTEGILGGWRPILVISSLAGFWALVVAKIPESPYWLASKGRQAEAKKVIHYLSEGKVKVDENTELVVLNMKQGSYLEIFKGKMLRLTVFQTIINFAFNFGYWGLFTWLPTLLQQKGMSMEQSLGFVALTAVCQIPGYLAASFLTGKYGRKKVLAGFVVCGILCGFAFAFASNQFQLYAFNFALGFFLLGGWGIWNTWLAEIYPTNIRGVGYSWGQATQRWSSTVAPALIGTIIGLGWAFGATVSIIVSFLVITLLAVPFLRETEGEILQ